MSWAETVREKVEPHSGVAALFNGDLHLGLPDYAPRDNWQVLSADVIVLQVPATPKQTQTLEGDTSKATSEALHPGSTASHD